MTQEDQAVVELEVEWVALDGQAEASQWEDLEVVELGVVELTLGGYAEAL